MMDVEFSERTVRRLTAAEGYLELNMPEYALEQLDGIEHAGMLEPAVHWLRGETLKAQHRFDEAIEPLQHAARTMPAPHSSRAWQALSECYRENGESELADLAECFANAPAQVIEEIGPLYDLTVVFRRQSLQSDPAEWSGESDSFENE